MTDTIQIKAIDHIEFYVGNAKQAAHYYKSAFGFQPVGYAGLETGLKDRTSFALRQGKITWVLTTPLEPKGQISDHLKKHGDGVKTVALTVNDAEKCFEETVKRGAKPYFQPIIKEDDHGKVKLSGIHTYGDTVHVFVERDQYDGPFLPGFTQDESRFHPSNTGLIHVDHVVGNVSWGEMTRWCQFYSKIFGFHKLISFDDKDISTAYSALKSTVMANDNEVIKLPINEPAKGKRKSQIEEYVEFYEGPGIQHIALSTADIIKTVTQLTERGVEFLYVPDDYYDNLTDRVGKIDENMDDLRKLGILIDRDEYGYLLQLFTKPVEDRPTLFLEIIQRKGARSFGKGNFKALFEAIEREQALRGTL